MPWYMWLVFVIMLGTVGYTLLDGYSQNPVAFALLVLGWIGYTVVTKQIEKLEEAAADEKQKVAKLEKRIGWLAEQD